MAAALMSCSPQAQDEIARNAARSAVAPVLAEHFPGVPLEPAVNCLINNASAVQIRALAADSLVGPTQSTVQIVSDIAAQPATIQCFATDGLPALLGEAQS